MTTIVTFLGDRGLLETKYTFGDRNQSHTGSVFAEVQNLEIQRETIEWYIERNYIVQALTLARAWIVSVVAYRFDLDILDYKGSRKPIEDALNSLRKHLRIDSSKISKHFADQSYIDKRL